MRPASASAPSPTRSALTAGPANSSPGSSVRPHELRASLAVAPPARTPPLVVAAPPARGPRGSLQRRQPPGLGLDQALVGGAAAAAALGGAGDAHHRRRGAPGGRGHHRG